MNAGVKGSCLVAMGTFVVFSGQPARAADGPLLVVVEAPPALEADAAEIRRAIGAELHAHTIAPMSTPAEASGRALIVALDRERIAMSLRANDGTSVARVIPAPADHAARLRAIAWLAGNLARDQVSPILAEGPAEPSPLATIPSLPATFPATEPPPTPAPSSPSVAPSSVAPPPNNAGGTTISIRTEPRSPPGPLRWSISGSVGPVIAGVARDWGTSWHLFGPQPSTAWQLTVQRSREHERLVIGGTLEGTYNEDGNGDGPQLIGANVFVGIGSRFRYFALEATIGAGPEAALDNQAGVTSRSTQMDGNTTSVVEYSVYRLDLYGQGTAIAAIPLGGSVEGLVGLGVHLNAFQEHNWFATATVGLRYELQ
jgi:hypothetical protein